MSNIKKAIELIGGNEPTPAQIDRIMAIAHALDIPTNDPMFPILVTLFTYNGVFNEANQSIKTSAVIVKDDLVEAVAGAANIVADRSAEKHMWKWAAGCITVSCLCFGLFGWFMYTKSNDAGYNSGYGAGYSKAVDEKAAASWSNTPEGKMAYKLAQTNQFKNLVHCDRSGWQIKDGVCFPHKAQDDKVYGWQLPSL